MRRKIIDVREPSEFAAGHAPDAVNIPLGEILGGRGLANTPKDAELILYCNSGRRSGIAKEYLVQQGYSKAVNGINRQQIERM